MNSSKMIDDNRDIVNLIMTHLEKEKGLIEELVYRDRIMGILGHDLQNPLAAVKMAVHVLNKRNDLSDESRKNVLAIQHAADRMAEMIETLLDVTRAKYSGKVPITRKPNNLGSIASEVVAEAKITWPGRSIEFEKQGDLYGDWDSARLAQVISNLLSNAINYGDPKAPVHIVVADDNDYVSVVVHNEGPVIQPDIIPVLFDAFKRGVTGSGTPALGLGLGLYIVKQIILAHEGTINVESTGEKGTTFTLHLPREPRRPAPEAPAENIH